MADKAKIPDQEASEPVLDEELPLPEVMPGKEGKAEPAAEEESAVEAETLEEPMAETEAEPPKKSETSVGDSRWARFKSWYLGNKKKSIPLTVLVLLLIIFGIPSSRYKLAGVALAKNYTLQVMDATANTPVSGALVSSGMVSTQTDGNGQARLKLSVGPHKLSISKKYYQDATTNVTVPILGQKSTPLVAFNATGRQVKVVVSNTISHQKAGDVKIKVLDIEAKTDKDGNATIVLPVGIASSQATLSADGYNDSAVTVEISDKTIKENKYNLTPAGKIYFLSKKSGKIDVVKTNLDGSDRKTVLAGTGKEDDTGTVMLASRDWKYLALLSRRDSDLAKLYIIETATDQTTAVDEGNADFILYGWSDDNFVYRVSRKNTQAWQANAQALKSFNAKSKQLKVLDKTDGGGSNDYDYAREGYRSVYLLEGNVIYVKSWENNYSNPGVLEGKQDGIYSITATGLNHKSLKSFDAKKRVYITSILYQAGQVYYQVQDGSELNYLYFIYKDGKVEHKSELAEDFYKNFWEDDKTYLQSPSGNETFYAESRDGKSVMMIGDENGEDGTEIASLSDEFRVYGWFSDNYVLVSKKSSELYIMPHGGVKDESKLFKISDYHKPAVNYYGYGGGYGGI